MDHLVSVCLFLPSPPTAQVQERPEEDEGHLTLHQPDVRGQLGAEERAQDQQACQRGTEAWGSGRVGLGSMAGRATGGYIEVMNVKACHGGIVPSQILFCTTCECVCVCVCVYRFKCVCLCVLVCAHRCKCVCMRACVHTRACLRVLRHGNTDCIRHQPTRPGMSKMTCHSSVVIHTGSSTHI